MKHTLLILALFIFGCNQEQPVPDMDPEYFYGSWYSESTELIFTESGYLVKKILQSHEYGLFEAWEFRTIGNQIAIDHILYDIIIVNEDQFIFQSEIYYRQ